MKKKSYCTTIYTGIMKKNVMIGNFNQKALHTFVVKTIATTALKPFAGFRKDQSANNK